MKVPRLLFTALMAASVCITHSQTRFASSVIAFSSQYDTPDYGALQALGAPDVFPSHSDDSQAWASQSEDAKREFLSLAYTDPIQVQSVVIYETYNPGAVDRIQLRDASTGNWNEVWTGSAAPAGRNARAFVVSFPRTTYLVDGLRIDLDSPAVSGWNEIDAIAIMDSDAASSGPIISNITADNVDDLYTQLAPEPVTITCSVADWISGVNTVTLQLLNPSGQIVGSAQPAERMELFGSSIYQDDWQGTITIPQGSTSGSYGLRITAQNDAAQETILDTTNLLTVNLNLPLPANHYELIKIIEMNDLTHSFNGQHYSIADFGMSSLSGYRIWPMINRNGQIAFQARVKDDSNGFNRVSSYLWDDGSLKVLIDGQVTSYSGNPESLNDSGWVAFAGQPAQGPNGNFIYKSNGETTTLIDDAPSLSFPSINKAGQVAYLQTGVERAIWIGDGTTRDKVLETGVMLTHDPEDYSGAFYTIGGARRLSNINMPRIDDNGRVAFYGIMNYDDPPDTPLAFSMVGTTRNGGVSTRLAANNSLPWLQTDRISIDYISVSDHGQLAFRAGHTPHEDSSFFVGGDPFGYLHLLEWIDGGRPGKVYTSALGLYGQSVNDHNVLAYLDNLGSHSFSDGRVFEKSLKRSPGGLPILQTHDYLDGRRVELIELGPEGINNAGEVAFLVRFADGHEALYLARPVGQGSSPVFAQPPDQVLETVPGGLITYLFNSVTEDWIELPPRGEATITTTQPGRSLVKITAIANHLGNPAQVVVAGNVVGIINPGESFDLIAATGTPQTTVTLKHLTVSSHTPHTLSVRLQCDTITAPLKIEGAGVPLLIQPPSQAVRIGDRLLIQSDALDPEGVTFQWNMDVLGDLSDGPRTFGSTNNQLQIYPYETTDAGTYTLTGVGSDGAASVSMQVINGQSFTDWIASYYPAAGSDQNIVGPNATPSADGISNIIKYALGLDPTHPVTTADRPRLFNVNRTFVGDSKGLELNLIMNPSAIDVAFGVEMAPASTGPWSELGAEDILMRESITDQGREVTATLPHMPTELAFYRISLGYIPR